jgi:hypothetical protein
VDIPVRVLKGLFKAICFNEDDAERGLRNIGSAHALEAWERILACLGVEQLGCECRFFPPWAPTVADITGALATGFGLRVKIAENANSSSPSGSRESQARNGFVNVVTVCVPGRDRCRLPNASSAMTYPKPPRTTRCAWSNVSRLFSLASLLARQYLGLLLGGSVESGDALPGNWAFWLTELWVTVCRLMVDPHVSGLFAFVCLPFFLLLFFLSDIDLISSFFSSSSFSFLPPFLP